MVTERVRKETTLTGKNQISLPVQQVRALHWERGDVLLVELLEPDMIVIMRRPTNWTEAGAGRLDHLFGTHDETIAWLENERGDWESTDVG